MPQPPWAVASGGEAGGAGRRAGRGLAASASDGALVPRGGGSRKGSAASSAASGSVGVGILAEDFLVPLRPKVKPFDHFDLMIEYDSSLHSQEEAARRQKAREKQALVRARLDPQIEEMRLAKEQSSLEKKKEREEVLALQGEVAKEEAAARQRTADKREDILRSAQEAQESILRRKQRLEKQRRREYDEVLHTLETEEKRKAEEAVAFKKLRDERATNFRIYLEETRAERAQRKLQQQEDDRKMIIEMKRVADEREAKAAEAFAARQAQLERNNASVGGPMAKKRAQEEKELNEREAFYMRERDRKQVEELALRSDVREKKLREMIDTNVRLAKERADRPDPQEAADKEQMEIWRRTKEQGDLEDKEKLDRLRRQRKDMDDHCLDVMRKNASMHRSDFGLTEEIRQKELRYHRDRLEKLDEGFRPEITQTLRAEAARASQTLAVV